MDIVAKFGGTSMSCASHIRQVADIIESDERRRFVVVSAAGKLPKDMRMGGICGDKVTDILISAFDNISMLDILKARLDNIASELNIAYDTSNDIDIIARGIHDRAYDFVISRGEYISARMLALFGRYEFCDAQELIVFDRQGVDNIASTIGVDDNKTSGSCSIVASNNTVVNLDKTYSNIARLKDRLQTKCIIPGFYGSDASGNIVAFDRGGSDISGAIVAVGVEALLYENWTDVSGVYTSDPNQNKDSKHIPFMTYEDMEAVADSGANVLSKHSIYPVARAGIPINIRNTFDATHSGTIISSTVDKVSL